MGPVQEEDEEMNIEEMDDVEPSDRMKRQAVWQLLAELKRYL